MAEQVEGSFTFTVLDASDSLYIVKGDSPLCLMRYPNSGVYVYASTAEILRDAQISIRGAKKMEIDSGEIVKIDQFGRATYGGFDDAKLYQPTLRYQRYIMCGGPRNELAEWMGYPPELIDRCLDQG